MNLSQYISGVTNDISIQTKPKSIKPQIVGQYFIELAGIVSAITITSGQTDLSDYYTKTQSDSKYITGYTLTATTLVQYGIKSGDTLFDGKYLNIHSGGTSSWNNLIGKPTTLSGYSITIGDTLFDKKYLSASSGITITNIENSLNNYALTATTLAGYNITDAYTINEANNKYLTGYTLTGTTLLQYNITDAYTKVQSDSKYITGYTLTASTLAGYGITDAYTKVQSDSKYITGYTLTASTLAGYGITDAYTKVQSDSKYLTGYTLTGTTLLQYNITDAYTKSQTDSKYITGYTLTATTLGGYGISSGDTLFDSKYLTIASATTINNIISNVNTNYYTKVQSDSKYITGYTLTASTLAGYGITDAYTKVQSDSKYITGNTSIIITATGQASGTSTSSPTSPSINLILSNSAVINQSITGYISNAGTVSPLDSIVGAIGKLNGNVALLTGSLVYQGLWNAATNIPTLTSSTGTKGFLYLVSVSGGTNLDGINNWGVGDSAVFDGLVWQRIGASPATVFTVFGRLGNVTAQFGDYSFSQISGTPITLSGYGISVNDTLFNNKYLTGYTLTASTLAGYGITDAYTKVQSDSKYLTGYTLTGTTLLQYNINSGDTLFDTKYLTITSATTINNIISNVNSNYYTKTQANNLFLTGYTLTASTLAGYGITDAYTKVQSDSKYITGYTLTASTLAGYGISSGDTLFDTKYLTILSSSTINNIISNVNSNYYTKTQSDIKYLTGDTGNSTQLNVNQTDSSQNIANFYFNSIPAATIDISGNYHSSGLYAMSNINDANITLGTLGVVIARHQTGATPVLTINQATVGATGDIVRFENQLRSVLTVGVDGSVTQFPLSTSILGQSVNYKLIGGLKPQNNGDSLIGMLVSPTFGTSTINTWNLTSGGTGYQDGTRLCNLLNGSGSQASASITISGGTVINADILNGGINYLVGDKLFIFQTDVNNIQQGTGGTVTVTSVINYSGLTKYALQTNGLDVYDQDYSSSYTPRTKIDKGFANNNYASLNSTGTTQIINSNFPAHSGLVISNNSSDANAETILRVSNNLGSVGEIGIFSSTAINSGGVVGSNNFVVNTTSPVAMFGTQMTGTTSGSYIFTGGQQANNILAGFLSSGYNWFKQLNRFGDSVSATTIVDILSGTTIIAPLKIGSGILTTTPSSGYIENDGSSLYYTDNTNTRYPLSITTGITLTFNSPLQISGNTVSIIQSTSGTSGYLSSTDWNKFNNKQSSIILTTTGLTGVATFGGGFLNVPQYSGTTYSPTNPSVQVGLTTINGIATTYMRSDASPALDQSINPTWTGKHLFLSGVTANTINNLIIIKPGSGATLSLVSGSTLGLTGSNSLIFNTTGNTNVSLPSSGIIYSSQPSSILSGQLAASMVDETGTGELVFAFSPIFRGQPILPSGTSAYTMPFTDRSFALATTNYVQGNFDETTIYFANGIFIGSGTTGSTYALNIDAIPKSGSTLPVESGGVYAAIAAISGSTGASGANPTASVGLTTINGISTSFIRSDAAPALSQSITPNWTGLHTFQQVSTGSTITDAILISPLNVTTSANTTEWSPRFHQQAFGWNPTALVNQTVDFYTTVRANSTNPINGVYEMLASVNGANPSMVFTVDNFGDWSVYNTFFQNITNIGANSTDGFVFNQSQTATLGIPLQKSTRTRYVGSVWNTTTSTANFFGFTNEGSGVSTLKPTASLDWYGYLGTGSTPTFNKLMSLDAATGNLSLGVGAKIIIGTGSTAATCGTAQLSSGTVTISTTSVTANSLIFVSYKAGAIFGTVGVLAPATQIAGTSFVINSLTAGASPTVNIADSSQVNWMLIN